jgi:tetratricopeptide (TPR) repeat protein
VFLRTWSLASIVVIALAVARPAPAQAAPADQVAEQEMSARTYFAASEYRKALDIYAHLYAMTLHPTYLRNIGRCYQNLHEPDKAISSFQEYLRKAGKLSDAERAEIEQYIREQEALKAAAEHKAEPAAPEPRPSLMPAPPAAADDQDAMKIASPASNASSNASSEAEPESSPIYKRWWFWTLIAVAAGGAVTAVVLTRGDSSTPEAQTTFGTMRAQ